MLGTIRLIILLSLSLSMTITRTAATGQKRRSTSEACKTMILLLEVRLEDPILTDQFCAERCDDEELKLKQKLDWKTDAETMLATIIRRAKLRNIENEVSPHYYIDQCLAQRRYCTSLKASYLSNALQVEETAQDSTARIAHLSKPSCSQSQPIRCSSDQSWPLQLRHCFCQVNLALLQVWPKPIEDFSVPGFEGCELQDICQRLNKRGHIIGPNAPWKCSGGFTLPAKVKCVDPLKACPCNFHFLRRNALRVDKCTDWSFSNVDEDPSSTSKTVATSRSLSTLDEDFGDQLEDVLSGDELQANQLDTLPGTIFKPKTRDPLSSSPENMHKNPAKTLTFICSDLASSSPPMSFAERHLTLGHANSAPTAPDIIHLTAEVSRIPLQMETSSVITSDFTLEALDESIAAVGADLDDFLSVVAEEYQPQVDALSGLQPSAAASHPHEFTCDAQAGQKRKFDQLSTRLSLRDVSFSGSVELASVDQYPFDVFPESHLFSDSIDHSASHGIFVPKNSEFTASEQSPPELANLLEPPQHPTNVERDAQEIWEEFFRRGIP